MKELIKKQHEECRKAYESLEDKASAAGLQLLGAMGAYEKLCPELKENEDAKLVNNLISTLSNLYARNLIEKETKEKYTNFLKALKPQDRWKPTAAQMYALKQEVENKIYSGVDSDLSSLYQDLIKLL